jgi:hypothetical protein
MSQVVIDVATVAKLLAKGEPVEIVDPDGTRVGTFTPEFKLTITEEELQRREQPNRKRYTTEEVLEKLRKLA